jgi:hypothetical protein
MFGSWGFRRLLYRQGATTSEAKEKKKIMKFLEGEYSIILGGVCMDVILLDSLIWWDHPHPFNHFTFSYIMMGFSWKRLSKIQTKNR